MQKRPVHCHRNISNGVSYLLGESNEIFMVRIHIGQLDVHEQDELVLGLLLTFSDTSVDDTFSLFSQCRKTCHLSTNIKQVANVTVVSRSHCHMLPLVSHFQYIDGPACFSMSPSKVPLPVGDPDPHLIDAYGPADATATHCLLLQ